MIAEELDTIAPESDGAIWASNDRLGSFEGCGFAFLTNLFESIDVFQKLLQLCPSGFSYPSFVSLLVSVGIVQALPNCQFVQHET